MSKSDVIDAVAILVGTVGLASFIGYSLLKGKTWYRRGVVYRETSPNLFWIIISFAAFMEIVTILTCITMLNHILLCDGKGTPKACLYKTLNLLI